MSHFWKIFNDFIFAFLVVAAIFFMTMLIMLTGCTKEIPTLLDHDFEIDARLDADENGYYHIEYTGTTYHSVYYQTMPNERVFWGSPDNFTTEWMWEEFETPIISYSTYADEWGNGQQLFYIDSESIGDTLMIYGYVNNIAWDYLYFVIE